MSQTELTPTTAAEPNCELQPLAGELTAGLGRLLESYQGYYKLTPEQARARLTENAADYAAQVRGRAPDQVWWSDLHSLAGHDEAQALQKWEEIKAAARDEVQSGHRAAKAIETPSELCWERARFLALRAELCEQWQPRNGVERQLIDTMAQAQAAYSYWLQILTLRAALERVTEKKLQEVGNWLPPRLDDAKAVQQAADLVDRFNKIFLRTLRALRDLRRFQPSVIVQNASQVNVGSQQVNVTG